MNYDLEDSFIDDNEGNISGIQHAGFIEPVVDDFICVRGSVQSFKASSYYQERVKTIKQSLNENTKKKKSEPKEPKEIKEPKPKEPREKKKVVKDVSGEKPKEFKEPKEKKKVKEGSAEKSKEPKEAKEPKEPKEAKEPKEPKKKNPGANKRKKSSGVGIERPANEEKRVKETKDNVVPNENDTKIIHIELS